MFDTCLILAGGRGTRLGALTEHTPKPLVRINKICFIHYMIEHMISHGVSNFIILTGYLGNQFEKEIIKYKTRRGLSVRLIQTDEGLNTQERVYKAMRDARGDCLVCYGDVYTELNISKYYEFFRRTNHDTYSVSAYKRHEYEKDNPIEFKDIGYHAFKKSWLEKNMKTSENIKFEEWMWEHSKNHYTYKDQWTYTSLTDKNSMMEMQNKFNEKATLLMDRDGVINKCAKKGEYIKTVRELKLNKGLFKMLKKQKKSIERVIIITNQPWLEDDNEVKTNHKKIIKRIQFEFKRIGFIAEYAYCPHSFTRECECRKPKTGLVNKYINKYKMLRQKVIVVGDSMADAVLAQNLGDVSFNSVRWSSLEKDLASLAKTIKSKKNSDHRYYRLRGLPHGRFDYK